MLLRVVLVALALTAPANAQGFGHGHENEHDPHHHAMVHDPHAGHGHVPEVLEAAAPEAQQADGTAPAPSVGYGRLALAAGAGLAGCALLAGYGSAVWRWARRIPLLLGFSRIARADLLDSATRRRIHEAVAANPGASTHDLARTLGLAPSSVAYHLRRLEKSGLVAGAREGRVRRWRVPGAAPPPAPLRHPMARALAEAARAEPGADQRSLAARLGISPTLAQWHLARLEAAGVVRKERDGRRVRYYG